MRRTGYIMPLSLLLTVVTCGMAFAHGIEKHDRSVSADVQMQKLHTMMPMFSSASAALESALEKNDAATVGLETGKIQANIPDLKKSRPHKNVKQKKKFIELAEGFGMALTATAVQANTNDFIGAKESFRKTKEICAACHAKFRD